MNKPAKHNENASKVSQNIIEPDAIHITQTIDSADHSVNMLNFAQLML